MILAFVPDFQSLPTNTVFLQKGTKNVLYLIFLLYYNDWEGGGGDSVVRATAFKAVGGNISRVNPRQLSQAPAPLQWVNIAKPYNDAGTPPKSEFLHIRCIVSSQKGSE